MSSRSVFHACRPVEESRKPCLPGKHICVLLARSICMHASPG
jgi:hypothetical protein